MFLNIFESFELFVCVLLAVFRITRRIPKVVQQLIQKSSPNCSHSSFLGPTGIQRGPNAQTPTEIHRLIDYFIKNQARTAARALVYGFLLP